MQLHQLLITLMEMLLLAGGFL